MNRSEENKEDILFVALDKHKGEQTILCVSRRTNTERGLEIVKMLFDEEAEKVYKKLTELE